MGASPPPAVPDLDEAQYASLARASRRAGVVSALGLVALLGSIVYSYVELGGLRKQIDNKKTELVRLERQAATVDAALKEKQQALEKITPAALQGLGYKNPYAPVAPKTVQESAEAKRLAERLAEPAERERRSSITLQYYAKKLDDEVNMRVVLTALSDAGFTLQRKQAQLPDVATNGVFFGPDVRLEDIKLVALTLIGAGIKLRVIEPLLLGVAKPRLIQIGADLAKRDAPPLTVEHIQGASSFTN